MENDSGILCRTLFCTGFFLKTSVEVQRKHFIILLHNLTDLTFSLHKTHYLLNFANALFSGLLALMLVVSVVLSFMIRDNIEHDINKVNVEEELGKAVRDVDLMNIWDSLQERSDAKIRSLCYANSNLTMFKRLSIINQNMFWLKV